MPCRHCRDTEEAEDTLLSSASTPCTLRTDELQKIALNKLNARMNFRREAIMENHERRLQVSNRSESEGIRCTSHTRPKQTRSEAGDLTYIAT
jgi:hypothetical protein